MFIAQNVKHPDSCVKINGTAVPQVDRVIHLGHLLTENVYEFNLSKYINDFNYQYNIMFFAEFVVLTLEIFISSNQISFVYAYKHFDYTPVFSM